MIYILLFAHFIGDFILQDDWMAINKSKRFDALALHVSIWTVVLCVAAALTQTRLGAPAWRPLDLVFFTAVNGVAHFIQDAFTSRLNARLWFFRQTDSIFTEADYVVPKRGTTLVRPWEYTGGSRHWFFVCIGADQMLHLALLFWTAERWL